MIFLEDIPLPLMVWSLGVLSGSSLHKQITHCEMKKTWKIAGSWTPGIRVQETFWFPILAQFRRKKGRDTSLKKKNAAYFRACLTFSPFKCSRWVFLAHRDFRTVKNILHDPAPPLSSECSYCVQNSMSQVKGFGASQGKTICGYVLL